MASASGRLGASKILQTRCSPLPFLSIRRTVDACASTCPPAGFFGSDMNIPPPGSAITAQVTKRTPFFPLVLSLYLNTNKHNGQGLYLDWSCKLRRWIPQRSSLGGRASAPTFAAITSVGLATKDTWRTMRPILRNLLVPDALQAPPFQRSLRGTKRWQNPRSALSRIGHFRRHKPTSLLLKSTYGLLLFHLNRKKWAAHQKPEGLFCHFRSQPQKQVVLMLIRVRSRINDLICKP